MISIEQREPTRSAHLPKASRRAACGEPICRRAAIALAMLVGLSPGASRAQELQPVLSIASGTGMSLGGGPGSVIRQRSPIFLDVDVGLIFDGDQAMEWSPGIIMELEGTVSIGVNPALKRFVHFKRFGMYGGLGFPFYFAPFTLLGAEAAVGATYRLRPLPRLVLVAEVHVDLFFAGSDLPDGSVLAKMDVSLGVRFDL